MFSRGGRQFMRGAPPQGRRRFRGQYVRSRMSPTHQDHPDDDMYGQQPSSLNSQHQIPTHSHQQNNHREQLQQSYHHQQPQQPPRIMNRNASQNGFEDIKDLCLKLVNKLDTVESRIDEIASSLEQLRVSHQRQPLATSQLASTVTATIADKRKKTKLLRRQNKSERDPQNLFNGGDPAADTERNLDRRRKNHRQELKEKPLPIRPNDDSTTQAADPSSEDKIEGENGDRVKRVIRRRKPNYNRRGYNRRDRMDSSERNSNDTSPQNEADDDEYRRPQKNRNPPKNNYPELSEAELDALVQSMSRDFFASEMGAVDKAIVENSPQVAKAFALAIIEHAVCDVTSPTKLSEIATNLSQAVVGIEGGRKFERAFYSALTEMSKREDDIVIDAPRYMDTLGQVLGQSLIPLNAGRNKPLMRAFLRQSVFAYGKKSGHKLLASILRALASSKDEPYAANIFGFSNLSFNPKIWNDEFLASQDIKFISKGFAQELRETRKAPTRMEKFADDVTNLVEQSCSPQKIEDLVKDLEPEAEEKTDYLGTLVYAIVRGCLMTDSGEYKLDTEALNEYSTLLKNQQLKREQQDAITLYALTALTKLWHEYNCPQNLMSNILLSLYNLGGASHEALKTWLHSDDLKHIPGIGAARLDSKGSIEDLLAAAS